MLGAVLCVWVFSTYSNFFYFARANYHAKFPEERGSLCWNQDLSKKHRIHQSSKYNARNYVDITLFLQLIFFFPELTFISFPLAYLLSKGERVRMFQPCHSNWLVTKERLWKETMSVEVYLTTQTKWIKQTIKQIKSQRVWTPDQTVSRSDIC